MTKRLVTNHLRSVLEHPDFSLTEEDFESGQHSKVLVRERTNGSKLQGAYRSNKASSNKEKGKIARTKQPYNNFPASRMITNDRNLKKRYGRTKRTMLFKMETTAKHARN